MIDFKIKICGITGKKDAFSACEYGADAIGLNFYTRSLRSVSLEKAQQISSSLQNKYSAKIVGVFANESAERINTIADGCNLDYVQLHGDESPQLVHKIEHKVIRAVRVSGVRPAQEQIDEWTSESVSAILLDAASGSQFGGTGTQFDWDIVKELRFEVPLILAGGLNCDNVTHAIMTAKPTAVDVASGIERFPGSKDSALMQAFITSAIDGFTP